MKALILFTIAILGHASYTYANNDQGSISTKTPFLVSKQFNLKQMSFESDGIDIFRSSVYLPGTRTNLGFETFLNDFPDNKIVRVNAFDWAVVLTDQCKPKSSTDYSNCIQEFRKNLETSSYGYLDKLTRNRQLEILMIDIFRTPLWLSSNQDLSSTCGGGITAHGHRPKDYKVWQELLKQTDDYFKQIETRSKSTKIYYQFWNEPSADCYWSEGTAEFLEFYAQTMPYLKSIHPTAKVGGAGLGSWDSRIASDGQTRPQNLNFDLMQFTAENKLPMDFVSFHYFSYDYNQYFIAAMKQYRDFQKSLGITENKMPILLTEWLTKSGVPEGFNPNQAVDAANLFIAMHKIRLKGQGGIPWQDYGSTPADEWGMLTFPKAQKKPIYYVYRFFDEISRTSAGISYGQEPISVNLPNSNKVNFTIGERHYLFSKLNKSGCYKMATWNRIAEPLEASIAYLFDEGITLTDLQNTYGKNDTEMLTKLNEAIKKSEPFSLQWSNVFSNAKSIYWGLDNAYKNEHLAYKIQFPDYQKIVSAKAVSFGREVSPLKPTDLKYNQNILEFIIRPQEFMVTELCLQ